jgi:hypothetical protein
VALCCDAQGEWLKLIQLLQEHQAARGVLDKAVGCLPDSERVPQALRSKARGDDVRTLMSTATAANKRGDVAAACAAVIAAQQKTGEDLVEVKAFTTKAQRCQAAH